jgi:hypothetical protein
LLATKCSLLACDIVVSLTADWGMDLAISMWHKSQSNPPKLIFGWTEPQASAGHAVLTGDSACIECGYDSTGKPQFVLTDWADKQDLQEPACGATFQSYGAVEVANTITLVNGLILDVILNKPHKPIHRFWAGLKTQLYASGGRWTRQWEEHPKFRDFGGLIVEQAWPPFGSCSGCKAK